MIDKFPDLHNNSVGVAILDSLQVEEDILVQNVDDVRNQFFVNTATWGVDRWEKMLGIPKNATLTLDTRKENIKAKMRTRGTTSLTVIKNICEAYSNGQVDIVVDHANYSFKIVFVGSLGIPKSFEEMDKTVNEIKPCHLAHSYEYTFNTHSNLAKHTHDELSHYTHEGIRVAKELR